MKKKVNIVQLNCESREEGIRYLKYNNYKGIIPLSNSTFQCKELGTPLIDVINLGTFYVEIETVECTCGNSNDFTFNADIRGIISEGEIILNTNTIDIIETFCSSCSEPVSVDTSTLSMFTKEEN